MDLCENFKTEKDFHSDPLVAQLRPWVLPLCIDRGFSAFLLASRLGDQASVKLQFFENLILQSVSNNNSDLSQRLRFVSPLLACMQMCPHSASGATNFTLRCESESPASEVASTSNCTCLNAYTTTVPPIEFQIDESAQSDPFTVRVLESGMPLCNLSYELQYKLDSTEQHAVNMFGLGVERYENKSGYWHGSESGWVPHPYQNDYPFKGVYQSQSVHPRHNYTAHKWGGVDLQAWSNASTLVSIDPYVWFPTLRFESTCFGEVSGELQSRSHQVRNVNMLGIKLVEIAQQIEIPSGDIFDAVQYNLGANAERTFNLHSDPVDMESDFFQGLVHKFELTHICDAGDVSVNSSTVPIGEIKHDTRMIRLRKSDIFNHTRIRTEMWWDVFSKFTLTHKGGHSEHDEGAAQICFPPDSKEESEESSMGSVSQIRNGYQINEFSGEIKDSILFYSKGGGLNNWLNAELSAVNFEVSGNDTTVNGYIDLNPRYDNDFMQNDTVYTTYRDYAVGIESNSTIEVYLEGLYDAKGIHQMPMERIWEHEFLGQTFLYDEQTSYEYLCTAASLSGDGNFTVNNRDAERAFSVVVMQVECIDDNDPLCDQMKTRDMDDYLPSYYCPNMKPLLYDYQCPNVTQASDLRTRREAAKRCTCRFRSLGVLL